MLRNFGRVLNWIGIASVVGPLLAAAVYGAADYVRYSGVLGEVWVVDGDTFDIGRQRYRLYGIDAPASDRDCIDAKGRPFACGEAAKDALEALVDGQKVSCEARDRDREKRIIAICYAGGYDLGAELVRQGHAAADTRATRQYVPQEREAKAARRGLWAGSAAAPETARSNSRH